MFRSLALESVGQEQHQPAQPAPFLLGVGDELVDDDLGGVDEVAELRLPQNEAVGAVEAIAIFETEHTDFGQRAVVDLDPRLIWCDVGQRGVRPAVLAIVEYRVAVAEGSAGGVLASQAHAVTLGGQGGERQRLGRGPVDGSGALAHLAPAGEPAGDGVVRMKSLGHARQRVNESRELASLDGGDDVLVITAGAAVIAAPDPDRRLAYGHVVWIPRLAQLTLELGPPFDGDALRLVSREPVEREQVRQVAVANWWALLDHPIHHGLSEGRLVALVVAATPVAIHVDDDVAPE